MNFKKFLGAFRNTSQIIEGIKNNIFKQEHVEAEAALRWAICKKCVHLDKLGDSCAVTGTQPCCSDCGCSLAFKTRSLSSECPKGKWPALMTEEEEELLNEQIEKNNDKD
mgnify:FL=1